MKHAFMMAHILKNLMQIFPKQICMNSVANTYNSASHFYFVTPHTERGGMHQIKAALQAVESYLTNVAIVKI